MNKKQKAILGIAAVLIALRLIFPVIHITKGNEEGGSFSFVPFQTCQLGGEFKNYCKVDAIRTEFQIFAIAIVTVAMWFINKKNNE